ncbi:hypothetical protein Vretimale_19406 [Volvox reticuliferus]|uniref:Uncharacterized protein n=1 Tax=Volvox reticuliferus TaxID=1737510 RepID=A0A8J4FZR2_9CHLO|nr:hypothetical protein Vretifemale_20590 [Volvox reticuliferus]GIM16817.1 hypothetical protein Vretimale_19406 [Volvox reticuliferus]
MWVRGKDPRPVQERGPPKAIQVQVALTAVPRPAPTALLARAGHNVVQLPGYQQLPDGTAPIGNPPLPGIAASFPASAATTGASFPASTSASIPTAGADALVGVTKATATAAAAAEGLPAAATAAAATAAATAHAAATATSGGPPHPPSPACLPVPSLPSSGPLMLMPLLPSTPEGRERLSRLVRTMARDLAARVLMDRHQERRWPDKLSVKVVTHGSYGRTSSKTCAFPSHILATPAAPAAASNTHGATAATAAIDDAGGRRATTLPGTAADSVPTVTAPTATGASALAPAAAAAPLGSKGSDLIVGEHTFYRPRRPSQLLDAVAAAAMGLCGAILETPGQLALGTTGQFAAPVVQAVQHQLAGSDGARAPAPVRRMARDAGAVAGSDATGSALLEPAAAAAARRCSRDDFSALRGAAVKRRRLDVGDVSADPATDCLGAATAARAAAGADGGPAYDESRIRDDAAPRGNGTATAATSHLNDTGIAAAATATAGPQRGQLRPQAQPQAHARLQPQLQLGLQPQLQPQLELQAQPQVLQRQPLRQPQPQLRAQTRPQAAGGRLRPRPCELPAQLDLIALLREMWCGQEDDGSLEGSGGRAGEGACRGEGGGSSLRRSEAVAEMAAQQMDAWLAVFGARPLEEWWSEFELGEEAARPQGGQRPAG